MEQQTTFAERFAYARVLAHFFRGEAPGNADIAKQAGRTGQWVTKWAASDTPPRDYEVHSPIAEYLNVDGGSAVQLELWLFRGEGFPPHEELWQLWLPVRRRRVLKQATAKAIKPKDLPRLVAERHAEEYGKPKKRKAK